MWTEKSAISTIDIAHTHIIMHYGLWHFEQWRIEIQLESPIWRRNGKTKWQKMWCDENREELCHFANEHNSTPFLIAPGWFLLLIFGWHLEYPGFKFKNTHKYTVINSGRVSLNLFVIIFHFTLFYFILFILLVKTANGMILCCYICENSTLKRINGIL